MEYFRPLGARSGKNKKPSDKLFWPKYMRRPPPKPVNAEKKSVACTSSQPPKPVGAALAEPGGIVFVVQVEAVRKRAEANTIARRLSGKGYPAFVTTAGANLRVRVGKLDDRRQAELTAVRLEREEQFKPWITR